MAVTETSMENGYSVSKVEKHLANCYCSFIPSNVRIPLDENNALTLDTRKLCLQRLLIY